MRGTFEERRSTRLNEVPVRTCVRQLETFGELTVGRGRKADDSLFGYW